MDNIQFGAFVAQLRKEQNMTQKELAQRLNVTDKAISKWETGKGFPDLKLLEPLAGALNVSLVELIQCRRQKSDTLTLDQAGQVASQAMDQAQRATARRYLRLFRWVLTGIGSVCVLRLIPWVWRLWDHLYFKLILSRQLGVIGSADGPTAIITSSQLPPMWLMIGLPAVLLLACVLLAVKVRQVEKRLK